MADFLFSSRSEIVFELTLFGIHWKEKEKRKVLLGINPLNQPVFFSTGQVDMAENTNDADEMRNWPMVNALGPVARSGDTRHRHDCVGAN